jgi:RNA polymerase sporulation-specific sigma factor
MQGKTQMEVAREVGISQAQVSRLEKGAIKKIKEF